MPTTDIRAEHKLTGNGFSSRETNRLQIGSAGPDQVDGSSEDASVCVHPQDKPFKTEITGKLPQSIGGSSSALFSELKTKESGRKVRVMSKGSGTTGPWSESVVDAGGGVLCLSDINLPSDTLQTLANRDVKLNRTKIYVPETESTVTLQYGNDDVYTSGDDLGLGLSIAYGEKQIVYGHDMTTVNVGFTDLCGLVRSVDVEGGGLVGDSWGGVVKLDSGFTIELWQAMAGAGFYMGAGLVGGDTLEDLGWDSDWNTHPILSVSVHSGSPTDGFINTTARSPGRFYDLSGVPSLSDTYSAELFKPSGGWKSLVTGSPQEQFYKELTFNVLCRADLPWDKDRYIEPLIVNNYRVRSLIADKNASGNNTAIYTDFVDSPTPMTIWDLNYQALYGDLYVNSSNYANTSSSTHQYPPNGPSYFISPGVPSSDRSEILEKASAATGRPLKTYKQGAAVSDTSPDVMPSYTAGSNWYIRGGSLEEREAYYLTVPVPPNEDGLTANDVYGYAHGAGTAYGATLLLKEEHRATFRKSSIGGVLGLGGSTQPVGSLDLLYPQGNELHDIYYNGSSISNPYPWTPDTFLPLQNKVTDAESGHSYSTAQPNVRTLIKGPEASDWQEYFDGIPFRNQFVGGSTLIIPDRDMSRFTLTLEGYTSVETIGLSLRENVAYVNEDSPLIDVEQVPLGFLQTINRYCISFGWCVTVQVPAGVGHYTFQVVNSQGIVRWAIYHRYLGTRIYYENPATSYQAGTFRHTYRTEGVSVPISKGTVVNAGPVVGDKKAPFNQVFAWNHELVVPGGGSRQHSRFAFLLNTGGQGWVRRPELNNQVGDSLLGAAEVLHPISVLGESRDWFTTPTQQGGPVSSFNQWFDAHKMCTDLLSSEQVANLNARLDEEVFRDIIPYKYAPAVVLEALVHTIALDYVEGRLGWDLVEGRKPREDHWTDEQYLDAIKSEGLSLANYPRASYGWMDVLPTEWVSANTHLISNGALQGPFYNNQADNLRDDITVDDVILFSLREELPFSESFDALYELDDLAERHNVDSTEVLESPLRNCTVGGNAELRTMQDIFRLCINSSPDSSADERIYLAWAAVAGGLCLDTKDPFAGGQPVFTSDYTYNDFLLSAASTSFRTGRLFPQNDNYGKFRIINTGVAAEVSDRIDLGTVVNWIDFDEDQITLLDGTVGTTTDAIGGDEFVVLKSTEESFGQTKPVSTSACLVFAGRAHHPSEGTSSANSRDDEDYWSDEQVQAPRLLDRVTLPSTFSPKSWCDNKLSETLKYNYTFVSVADGASDLATFSDLVLDAEGGRARTGNTNIRMVPLNAETMARGFLDKPGYFSGQSSSLWPNVLPHISLLDYNVQFNALQELVLPYRLRSGTIFTPSMSRPMYNVFSEENAITPWTVVVHKRHGSDIYGPQEYGGILDGAELGYAHVIRPESSGVSGVADYTVQPFTMELETERAAGGSPTWVAESDPVFDGTTGLFLFETGESRNLIVGELDYDRSNPGTETVVDSLLDREFKARQDELDDALANREPGRLYGKGVDSIQRKGISEVGPTAHPSLSTTSGSLTSDGDSNGLGLYISPGQSGRGVKYYQYSTSGGDVRYMYPVFSAESSAQSADSSFGGSGTATAYRVTSDGTEPTVVADPASATLAAGEYIVYLPDTQAVDLRDDLSREFIQYTQSLRDAVWERREPTNGSFGQFSGLSLESADGYEDTLDMFFAGADVVLSGRDTYPIQSLSYSNRRVVDDRDIALIDGTHTISDLTGKGRVTPGTGGSVEITVAKGEVTEIEVTDPGSGFTLGSGIYLEDLKNLGLSDVSTDWMVLKVDEVDLQEGAPVDPDSPVNPSAGNPHTAALTWSDLAAAGARPESGGLSSDPDPGRAVQYAMYNLGLETDNNPGEPWFAPSPCDLDASQQEAVKAGLTLSGSRLASRFLPGSTGTEIQPTRLRRMYRAGLGRIANGDPQHAMASASDDPFTIDDLYLDDFLHMRYVARPERI